MAEEKKPESKKVIKKLGANKKKVQTVRERTAQSEVTKPKRIRNTAGRIRTPLTRARKIGKKEYHMPLPDNKFGRFLRKRVRFMPKFVVEAFREIRQVTWPDRKSTVRLTIAVFIFAVVFAAIVGLLDFVLGELFQKFIVEK